jgi:hypothetical protein
MDKFIYALFKMVQIRKVMIKAEPDSLKEDGFIFALPLS